jgi:hypothetical protein
MTLVEIWFEDEARIRQKNGQVGEWARRGTRPRQPAEQCYDNAYLVGTICPARGVGGGVGAAPCRHRHDAASPRRNSRSVTEVPMPFGGSTAISSPDLALKHGLRNYDAIVDAVNRLRSVTPPPLFNRLPRRSAFGPHAE